jgi:quercetin dioxygenase-like cupin family protein
MSFAFAEIHSRHFYRRATGFAFAQPFLLALCDYRHEEQTMRYRTVIVATLLVIALALAGRLGAQETVLPAQPAEPLLSTGTTILGETLHYPTNGPAHVTASIVTLPPGGRTILHKHGVPMFAYVLEGEITVDYGDCGKRTFHQGDALMEATDAAHFGADAGLQPVRILTVFMGADGAPPNVIPVQP